MRCPNGFVQYPPKSGKCVPKSQLATLKNAAKVVKPSNSSKSPPKTKKKRCPKGTRRSKLNGKCVPITPVLLSSPKERGGPTPPKTKKKRCPKGTRRSKLNGKCVPKTPVLLSSSSSSYSSPKGWGGPIRKPQLPTPSPKYRWGGPMLPPPGPQSPPIHISPVDVNKANEIYRKDIEYKHISDMVNDILIDYTEQNGLNNANKNFNKFKDANIQLIHESVIRIREESKKTAAYDISDARRLIQKSGLLDKLKTFNEKN